MHHAAQIKLYFLKRTYTYCPFHAFLIEKKNQPTTCPLLAFEPTNWKQINFRFFFSIIYLRKWNIAFDVLNFNVTCVPLTYFVKSVVRGCSWLEFSQLRASEAEKIQICLYFQTRFPLLHILSQKRKNGVSNIERWRRYTVDALRWGYITPS